MRLFSLPPMLKGTPEQQIAQLKDYLVQLVLTLNEESQQAETTNKEVKR